MTNRSLLIDNLELPGNELYSETESESEEEFNENTDTV